MSLMLRKPTSAPALLALLLVIVLAADAGCGLSSTSASPPTSAVIVTRMSAMANSPIGSVHHLDVSISCDPGEQMLAGGYVAEDVFESDYSVLTNYPSGVATWTVSVDSGSTFQLEAMVYCLSSYPSLGIQILRADTCPPGAVQTAMGFQGANPYGPSGPSTGTPYMLCSFHYAVATGAGFRLGSTEVTCASQSTGNNLSESRTFSYTCSVQS
jgi:hypothetical protein